nr:MAG TPA: hypothetical protein [Caudoviricetes sp.]
MLQNDITYPINRIISFLERPGKGRIFYTQKEEE